ncbi:hypothetical protein D3C75_373950 [compost metagenome]
MLWKWQSKQRFDLHCGGLSQTVAIRPIADLNVALKTRVAQCYQTARCMLQQKNAEALRCASGS